MRKVRLKFSSISEIVGTEELGLLTLIDETETRQLTITCEKEMIRQFEMRVQRLNVVSRMLPEVLWQVVSTQTNFDFEIVISDLIEGQYRAMLVNVETQEAISMRASDAILLSYIGKLPLYIEEGLMLKQSMAYRKGEKGVAIPVNTISDDMLRSALEKAVADENYELASHLRDELRKRSEDRKR